MDDGRLIDGDPKSRAGTRTVAFPADIVPELADHLERFAEASPNGLVFIGPKGGRLRRSNFRDVWYRARGAAGLPELHFHDYADVCVMPTRAGESLAAGVPARFMSA
jgi:integrase